MSDPLSAAIEAAVDRAMSAQIPKILEAIKSSSKATAPAPQPGEDRFVRMDEAARLLGVHRSTLHRLEKVGKLPRRRNLGRSAGWLMSEIRSVQTGDFAGPAS